MIYDQQREELFKIFKEKHMKILNDFTPLSDLFKKNDKEFKLIVLAISNIREFLSRPRYFYAIIDCININYGVDEFDLIKCNQVKIGFEIIRTICFNLIKPSYDDCFKEYCSIKKSSGEIDYLCDLLDSELIDALFKEMGYKSNANAHTYEFDSFTSQEQKKDLIEIAFDSYLNFYFYDNVLNYLNQTSDPKPLKVIEFLLGNKGVGNFDSDKIYKCLNDNDNCKNENQLKLSSKEESKNNSLTKKASDFLFTHNTKSDNTIVTTILTNDQWSCAICTYLNEPNGTTCSMCHTAKNLPNATFL